MHFYRFRSSRGRVRKTIRPLALAQTEASPGEFRAQIHAGERYAEPFAVHPGRCIGTKVVSHGRWPRRNRRKEGRSALSERQTYGDAEDQETAHGRVRGRRIPVPRKKASSRFSIAWPL